MAQLGPIDIGFARVFCSSQPTDHDEIGCQGLYIERVELKPWYKWPIRYAALFLWAFIVKGNRINRTIVRPEDHGEGTK